MSHVPIFRLDSSSVRDHRWHLAPALPDMVLRCDAATGMTTCRCGEETLATWDDPLAALGWLGETSVREMSGTRWVGFISYDLGRLFEKIPSRALDDLNLPWFAFARCRKGLDVPPAAGWQRRTAPQPAGEIAPRSTFSAAGFRSAVARVIEFVRAGDIFQANLSQRFSIPHAAAPREIYEKLLRGAPARHGGLLDFGDFALVSNSPELFLRVTPDPHTGRRRLVTRPIKGTRPLQTGMDGELRDSIKDQAELNMIIDLERNDLGRICEMGSVKVTEPRTIEAHPTVYHGAATIEGILRHDVTLVDMLRAMFPGGSITGAPKIRAMEIIEELEPVRRGPYCGAIGYLAADGSIEFNIAIRTMIVKDQWVHVPVGGGIVADSDPAAEYEETLVKARAMFAALGVSPDDLR